MEAKEERGLSDEAQKGAQLVIDWLDEKFNLWQDDANHYHITIYRHDFHVFLKKYGLHFQGGW